MLVVRLLILFIITKLFTWHFSWLAKHITFSMKVSGPEESTCHKEKKAATGKLCFHFFYVWDNVGCGYSVTGATGNFVTVCSC